MRPLAVLLAAALAACADPAPAGRGTDEPDELALTRDGAGRLGAATPFDTTAIQAALPAGFTVEAHTGAAGAPVVWALRDGQIVFEVYPDAVGTAVGRIDAPNAAVAGPQGARPGQTFAEAGGAGLDCAPGTSDLADRAVCTIGGVEVVFASAALVGQTALPADDALADAFLERLVWRADG